MEVETQILNVLKEIRDNQKTILNLLISENKKFFTEEEAAAYLNVSVNYIKGLMYTSHGVGPKIGFYLASNNNKYIAREELDNFVTRIRYKSEEEMQAEAAEGKKKQRRTLVDHLKQPQG